MDYGHGFVEVLPVQAFISECYNATFIKRDRSHCWYTYSWLWFSSLKPFWSKWSLCWPRVTNVLIQSAQLIAGTEVHYLVCQLLFQVTRFFFVADSPHKQQGYKNHSSYFWFLFHVLFEFCFMLELPFPGLRSGTGLTELFPVLIWSDYLGSCIFW